MTEIGFTQLADELMLSVEDAIEGSGLDIDYESTGGVLTLTIEAENSKVIVSRQRAMSQVWLAARSGGFYLDHHDQNWRCTTTGETFEALLNRVCREQGAGEQEVFERSNG
ncbi:iron donor protein CyaY [uncultured Porticoccus sp.]|uniref:iron donor protein CyaY n=1 Tax=uncultured Porticoccus sp. TaxID=1256050 RepID=UPI0030DB3428|tara:strand:- start:1845 stop:2177 length:333 start_codon:yes stop_codon:yes gene_type:complete